MFGSQRTDIIGHRVRSSNPTAFENANPLSEGVDLLRSVYPAGEGLISPQPAGFRNKRPNAVPGQPVEAEPSSMVEKPGYASVSWRCCSAAFFPLRR
jgi:hypothetical protein